MKTFRVVSSSWNSDSMYSSEYEYSVKADEYMIHYDDNVVVLSFYAMKSSENSVSRSLIASFINFDYVTQLDDDGFPFVSQLD